MSASRFAELFVFLYFCPYYSWDNSRLDTKGEEQRGELSPPTQIGDTTDDAGN